MIDKNGWTKDSKTTGTAKQERFIHGGDLTAKQAAYVSKEKAKGELTQKLKKVAGIASVGKPSSVIRSKGV